MSMHQQHVFERFLVSPKTIVFLRSSIFQVVFTKISIDLSSKPISWQIQTLNENQEYRTNSIQLESRNLKASIEKVTFSGKSYICYDTRITMVVIAVFLCWNRLLAILSVAKCHGMKFNKILRACVNFKRLRLSALS